MTFVILDLATQSPRPASAEEVREEFNRHGVVVFPRFFPPAEIAATRDELTRHYRGLLDPAATRKAAEQGCDVVPWDPCAAGNATFLALRHHDRMGTATTVVLGDGWTSPGSLVMYSVAGGRGQAWHQDCPADGAGSRDFNLNRLIYPEDVSWEDGAIVFVPGSHLLGRIPPGGHSDPMPGEIACTPVAGTLVFLHGHVFHRVTPNLNAKPRISTNFRAYPAGTDPGVNCIGVYRNGTVNFCDRPKRHDGTPA